MTERTYKHCHAVILAGGRGTRFWPSSRESQPKQLLNVLGEHSLLQQTVQRLGKIFSSARLWVITSQQLKRAITKQLPQIPVDHIIAEPLQRNTAPAIGLAAFLLQGEDPDAIMGVFPADHCITEPAPYTAFLRNAMKRVDPGKLLVFGIKPRCAETGYGYIEFPKNTHSGNTELLPVTRFREKPTLAIARKYVAAGNYYWNSGQFVWKVEFYLEELKRHLPKTWKVLEGIAKSPKRQFSKRLKEDYPKCQNISVDHGILEHSHNVAGFAAPEIGWNDLGNWDAVYSQLPKDRRGNCSRTAGLFLDSSGNFLDVPGKQVVLLDVNDLVIVETPDALLVCPRNRSQDVGSVVQALRKAGKDELL